MFGLYLIYLCALTERFEGTDGAVHLLCLVLLDIQAQGTAVHHSSKVLAELVLCHLLQ